MGAALAITRDDREEVSGLIALVGRWHFPQHPNVAQLANAATQLIKELEDLVASPFELIPAVVHEPAEDSGMSADDLEDMRAFLEQLRAGQMMIEGVSLRIIERDVRKHVPQLLGRLQAARGATVDRLRELRAVVAFLVGEHDDAELGIEVVPPAPVMPRKKPKPPSDLLAP